MKKSWIFFLLFAAVEAGGQDFESSVLRLLGRWDDTTIAPAGWLSSRYAGCTGWVDPLTGHEYAIVGSQQGTHFIDLADPANPVQVDFVPGRRDECIWREFQTYGNYAYMVSDDTDPNSLQIADLSYLPDSVHLVYDSDSLFKRAHTIFIEGDKLYAGSVTVQTFPVVVSHPMAVYSLTNPERPQLIRSLRQDYPHIPIVHDMHVRNDTVYASCALQGLHVFVFEGGRFHALDSFSTGNTQYNHSSSLSEDGRTLFFCEEVPSGRPIYALDVSDPHNIVAINNFTSHLDATPHNPYFLRNYLFVAYYMDGLQVFDVSNPLNVTIAGYLDTYPDNIGFGPPAYRGAWGAWPYLPSGHVLVSDMQQGLFVVDADSLLRVPPVTGPGMFVFPNPSRDFLTVGFTNRPGITYSTIHILDIAGRIVLEQKVTGLGLNKEETLNIGFLAKGMYLVQAYADTGEEIGTVKFIKQ